MPAAFSVRLLTSLLDEMTEEGSAAILSVSTAPTEPDPNSHPEQLFNKLLYSALSLCTEVELGVILSHTGNTHRGAMVLQGIHKKMASCQQERSTSASVRQFSMTLSTAEVGERNLFFDYPLQKNKTILVLNFPASLALPASKFFRDIVLQKLLSDELPGGILLNQLPVAVGSVLNDSRLKRCASEIKQTLHRLLDYCAADLNLTNSTTSSIRRWLFLGDTPSKFAEVGSLEESLYFFQRSAAASHGHSIQLERCRWVLEHLDQCMSPRMPSCLVSVRGSRSRFIVLAAAYWKRHRLQLSTFPVGAFFEVVVAAWCFDLSLLALSAYGASSSGTPTITVVHLGSRQNEKMTKKDVSSSKEEELVFIPAGVNIQGEQIPLGGEKLRLLIVLCCGNGDILCAHVAPSVVPFLGVPLDFLAETMKERVLLLNSELFLRAGIDDEIERLTPQSSPSIAQPNMFSGSPVAPLKVLVESLPKTHPLAKFSGQIKVCCGTIGALILTLKHDMVRKTVRWYIHTELFFGWDTPTSSATKWKEVDAVDAVMKTRTMALRYMNRAGAEWTTRRELTLRHDTTLPPSASSVWVREKSPQLGCVLLSMEVYAGGGTWCCPLLVVVLCDGQAVSPSVARMVNHSLTTKLW